MNACKKGDGHGADVTMIMPTRNRARFVCAYLSMLSKQRFDGHLVVADASDVSLVTSLTDYFETLDANFELTVLHVPKSAGGSAWTSINECIEKATSYVDTSYACLCFDDDFILPVFLTHATQLLDEDDKLGFVVGGQLALNTQSVMRSALWLFSGFSARNIRSIEDSQAVSRVENFFRRPFQLAYAVVRKETILKYVPKNHRDYFSASLCSDYGWYCAILVSGKGRFLRSQQVLRLFHDTNTKTYGQGTVAICDALICGNLGADVGRLTCRLKELISQKQELESSVRESDKAIARLAVIIITVLLSVFSRDDANKSYLAKVYALIPRIVAKSRSWLVGLFCCRAISQLNKSLKAVGI